jgi:hypothetical protein
MISPKTILEDMGAAHDGVEKLEKTLGRTLSPPTNLEALANEIGLKVVYSDELPDKVGGFLSNPTEDGGLVVVNSKKSKVHQQYSIAHEIGHYWLFHDFEFEMSEIQREQEANAFAFFLLGKAISANEVQDFVKENPDLFEISNLAGMTGIGMLFQRIPWLGIPLMLGFSFLMHNKFPQNQPPKSKG